jgi:hypothetical protein
MNCIPYSAMGHLVDNSYTGVITHFTQLAKESDEFAVSLHGRVVEPAKLGMYHNLGLVREFYEIKQRSAVIPRFRKEGFRGEETVKLKLIRDLHLARELSASRVCRQKFGLHP